MATKSYNPYTPTRRFLTNYDFSDLTKKEPEKQLLAKKVNRGGRNNWGRQTNINKGGGIGRAHV